VTEGPLAEPSLDPVLGALSYEVIEMLRWFGQDNSFREIGSRFGCDERTVSRQLLALDEAFEKTQGLHIIYRPRGKNYQLTPEGRIFVAALEPITDATRAAVEAAASSTRRVPVVCTSNCLELFRRLANALPRHSGFDPIPESRRTAEIDLARPPGTDVFLASVLMSTAQNPMPGSLCHCSDRIEALPVSVDPLQLLSVGDLGLGRSVTVRNVIEAGVTLIAPTGGVAWDFLNRSYPDWRRLRPFQHVPATDLDFGLKCLANELIPRAAMVVHGLRPDMLKRYSLEAANVREFAANGPHAMVAVTGIFHMRSAGTLADSEPYEVIWEAAQSVWSERERVI
jgi:hypothetical protein